ncbi:hypothetical protein CMU66_12295 [Elizabethkingia anophelis]|uniref:glycosyltransferase family 4 protein n=1 Tax=Elizabethkingia anophelis TaxID=1117645 RepID=UPI00293CCD8A|nr:glycosyltransferase family 4 protein [Elizabethkingia anophelis]MDV3550397.1 hypothetical protein [Elizabethkingia anophelis]MDV3564590.1 hypothetical protein [Elizabethkingia anophelis]MDV3624109.1 hypothetical protein [Elizabethkingia anophelis]MDV3643568.1 hypothetical protein [Elizabethkingia anophelis]
MMNVHFFTRKFNPKFVSIEKLFSNIKREFEKKDIHVNLIEEIKEKQPLGFIKTLFYFRKNQSDINHIIGAIHWSCFLLNRNKTILTIHDLGNYDDIKSFIKKKLYYLLWIYLPIKRVKYITVISEKTKEDVIKYVPSAKDKISVIHNCLLIDDNTDVSHIPSDKPVVLAVGYYEKKNLDRILQAIVGLNVKLILIGQLSEERKIFINQNNLDVEENFMCSEDKLYECYRKANVLCFPSLFEGFGLPILEAQYFCIPVITSNISPMKDVAGRGALLIDPYSVDEIKKAISRIILDQNLSTELIQLGKENLKNYLPEKIADTYLKFYQKVLNKI